MFCTSCGSTLTPGALHCGSCGSQVPKATAPDTSPAIDGQQNYQASSQAGSSQTNYEYTQQQPYYNAPASGKAIASLVLSLLGVSLLGLIFGSIARKEIRNSQGQLSGDGMALAGLILGWIGTIGWTFIWIAAFAAAAMSSSYYY